MDDVTRIWRTSLAQLSCCSPTLEIPTTQGATSDNFKGTAVHSVRTFYVGEDGAP